MPELSWPVLQTVALDGAHPAWFGEMDSALLAEARGSASGRRLLARELAQRAAPVLFGSFPAVLPHALSGNHWMMLSGERLAALALDLGGLALSPAIRTRIERAQVLRLRRVLGAQRYAQVLGAAREDTMHLDQMQDDLDRALASDEDLASLIHRTGLAEWLAFVAPLHPVAVERLRLFAAPGDAMAATTPRLEAADIARHLALAAEIGMEAAND